MAKEKDKKNVTVLGATGKVGQEVLKELIATTQYHIKIAVRDIYKGNRLAKKYNGRVQVIESDINKKDLLYNSVRGSDLVINCTGPSYDTDESIAKAAFTQGCHYVDAGGYEETTEKIKKHNDFIKQKELVVCTSAGLLPGYTGIVARFLAQQYRSVKDLKIYYLFNDRLSYVSSKDMVIEAAKGNIEYYHNRSWRKTSIINGVKKFKFPDPFNSCYCVPGSTFEIVTVPVEFNIENFSFYMATKSFMISLVTLTAILVGKLHAHFLIPAVGKAMQLGTSLTRRNNRGYILCAVVTDDNNESKTYKSVNLDSYKTTAVVAATAARLILNGSIKKYGSYYLYECVDPGAFLKNISERGIHYEFTGTNE